MNPLPAICGASLLIAAACSSGEGDNTGATEPAGSARGADGSTNGSRADDAPLPPGNVASGTALVDKNGCATCHAADYGGVGFNPNLTPESQFGLGAWSDAQVAVAIRRGVAKDGTALCSIMERFPFSAQETADVIAFLRSLPVVTRANSSMCPGHGNRAM